MAGKTHVPGARRQLAGGSVDEVKVLAALADIGELAGSVTHEFSNFLNTLTLHLAVLEPLLTEPTARSDVAEIRKQMHVANGVVREFQRRSGRQLANARSFDFNGMVTTIVNEFARAEEIRSPVPFLTKLQAGLPEIESSPLEFERLCRFLLRNALAATVDTGAPVAVCTGCTQENLWLSVEGFGPTVSPEGLIRFFQASRQTDTEISSLELAACNSIVRRLNGSIRAENVEKRVKITVVLPASAVSHSMS